MEEQNSDVLMSISLRPAPPHLPAPPSNTTVASELGILMVTSLYLLSLRYLMFSQLFGYQQAFVSMLVSEATTDATQLLTCIKCYPYPIQFSVKFLRFIQLTFGYSKGHLISHCDPHRLYISVFLFLFPPTCHDYCYIRNNKVLSLA